MTLTSYRYSTSRCCYFNLNLKPVIVERLKWKVALFIVVVNFMTSGYKSLILVLILKVVGDCLRALT